MTLPLIERDQIISREMLAHVPLFSHPKPHKIAILSDENEAIKQEVLKHANITEIHLLDSLNITCIAPDSLDVLISTKPIENYSLCFQLLHNDGIFVQLCDSPFNLIPLKETQQKIKSAGFHDTHLMQFPQPDSIEGWRAAVVAVKYGILKRPREKAIYTKSFATHYYNLDVHKTAFALPEFMRTELV